MKTHLTFTGHLFQSYIEIGNITPLNKEILKS